MIEKTILQELFRQHYNEMIHLAKTLLYSDEEAEDMVQDVFMRLIEGDFLPDKEKTRAYLMTAVHNRCINRIMQKSLAEQVKSLYSIETQSDWHDIEERLQSLDSICHYADCHLKEPHRTIFRLRFNDGMSLKEIAQQLNMNLKTVFKYISQSIQSIQKNYRH